MQFDKIFFRRMAYQYFSNVSNLEDTLTVTRKNFVLWLIDKDFGKQLGSFTYLYNNITKKYCTDLFEIRDNNMYRKKIRQLLYHFNTEKLKHYAEVYPTFIPPDSIESKILIHIDSKNSSLYEIIANYLQMPKNKLISPDIPGKLLVIILEFFLDKSFQLTEKHTYKNRDFNYATWKYVRECRLSKSSPEKSVLDDYLSDTHNEILLEKWFDDNISKGIWKQLPSLSKKMVRKCSKKASCLFRSFNLMDLMNDRKFSCLYYNLYCYINKENHLEDNNIDWGKVAGCLFNYCFNQLKAFAEQHNRLLIPQCDFTKQSHSSIYYMKDIDFVIKYFNVSNNDIKAYTKFLLKYSSMFQSAGERKVAGEIIELGFNVIMQKKFSDCRNKNELPFDIFSDSGTKPFIVEIDGPHHFAPVNFWGGDKTFQRTIYNDSIKNRYCQEHGILLLRIPYSKINHSKDIIKAFLRDNNILDSVI